MSERIKRIGNLRIYEDRCVHYRKSKNLVATRKARDFPSVPGAYFGIENIIIELPYYANSKHGNFDQFNSDLDEGKLDGLEGRFAAYKDGFYRGNLEDRDVLYFMCRHVIGIRSGSPSQYLTVFKVPEKKETLKEALRQSKSSPVAKLGNNNNHKKRIRPEPRYRTHSEI